MNKWNKKVYEVLIKNYTGGYSAKITKISRCLYLVSVSLNRLDILGHREVFNAEASSLGEAKDLCDHYVDLFDNGAI